MKAFHGDPNIKQKYLDRLKAHHVADRIIQGIGWADTDEGFRGCAIGCTLENYAPGRYPDELGLPVWIGKLEERIFEGLPPQKAPQFSVDFLASIDPGANVEKVRWQLAMLRADKTLIPIRNNPAEYAKECISAIERVKGLCFEKSLGDSIDRSKWMAASRSARSASRSAAWAAWAAWSAARSAAWAAWAAWAAAWSAEAAAWSAEAAARSAEAAARSAEAARSHYEWEAEMMIRLLKECKPESES